MDATRTTQVNACPRAPGWLAAVAAGLLVAAALSAPAGAEVIDLDFELTEGEISFGGSQNIELPDDGSVGLLGTWDDESGALEAELDVEPFEVQVSTSGFGVVPVLVEFPEFDIDGTADPETGVVSASATFEIILDVAFQPDVCTIGPISIDLGSEPPGYPLSTENEAVGLTGEDGDAPGAECPSPGDPHEFVQTEVNQALGLPSDEGTVVLLFGSEQPQPPPPPPTTTTTTTVPPSPDPTPSPDPSPDPAPGLDEEDVGSAVGTVVGAAEPLLAELSPARSVAATPRFTG